MIPAEIIRNHGSSIVVHNFDTLVNQFDAFHLIHSAVGLLDPENHLIFENNTFKELNLELRDSPEYFASHQSLLECPTLITSVNEAFSSKEPTILKHRFYYTSTIHVDLSLCFTPILTNKDNTVHGLLCTIGEESIGFETKHLAKLQDKLSRLKKRIKHLDKEKMHNDHLVKVLFNEAPTAMLLLNSERHILQANINAMKLFGFSSKILIGKSCTTILDCSQTCNCCPLMDNQNIKSDEINGIGRDGKAIPLLRSAVKFRDVNETILIEAFMDLRETKQAQSESRAKSAFLANMTHEIRTPLTAIIGYAETLLDRNESMSDRIKSTNTIIRSSRHLQQLINKILDLSKIEAEKMDVEKIEVSIFGLLSEVQSIALSQAQSKRLDFSIDYDFPLPENIINDPVRMRQILINLCSNAIKFTQQGSVRVHVGYSQKDNKMVFKVIDTGIGMTSEQRSKIFHAFTQADALTTREYGGTGLGLHLSKQMAELLGGNLAVESKPGQGSCFTFTADSGNEDNLSFANSLPQQSQHIHEVTAFPDRKIVSGRVLLAEDNIDNQQLISLYLRKAGAEVTIAVNGKVAVDLAQSNNFDLILMDMQMPVMNGIEASEKLRTNGYSGAIVALTANTMQEYIDQYYKVGCSGFLGKPIDRERFYNVLTKHLPPADAAGEPMEPLRSTLLDEDGDFAQLVEEYIQGFPQMLAQLRKLFEKKDWESLKRQAHDLKGTSGNYGFMEVMERSLKLQFEIEKMDSHGVSLLLDELDILYQRMLL